MAEMKLYELVNHYHIGTELTCAEAMFMACNEYYHLNLSEETRKMFSVMGLGMQTEQSCCGAFTVAVGIIGLMTAKEGQTDVSNMEGYGMIAELTDFMLGFYGTLHCIELQKLEIVGVENPCHAIVEALAKKLEEFDPMFIEEPVLCEQMEDFKEIAAACNVPIATGERLFSRYDFKRLLQAGGVDIIQPDLSHAGGITEVKKIASMAEAYDVALAPHCPLGPIALSACLQVDATCYNAFIQEQSMGIHYNAYHEPLDYILNKEDLAFHDGHVELPKRPGLGVELDREQLQKAHQLYLDNCLGGRDDAVGMQYLIPGWTFDPKRPCLVR